MPHKVEREENSIAWLEAALADNLRPVSAPAQLWDRVEMPRTAVFTDAGRPAWWSLGWRLASTSAVAAMLVVGLWTFGRFKNQEFRSSEFRSSDAGAIRAWVKDRCGFALPLSAQVSPQIQLSAVRREKSGSAAELAFRVENRPASLQIAQVDGAPFREPAHHELAGGARSVSWMAEGRLFTLACATPEDLRIACSLCHGGGVL